MFYPIFLLPQVKRSVIISNKHGIYEFGSNILWKIVGRIDVVDRYDYLITKCQLNFIGVFEIYRIARWNKVILLQSMTVCFYKVRQVL